MRRQGRSRAIIIAVSLTAAVRAEAASFESKTLAVDGDMLEVIASDFDGDAKKDLLAIYKRGVPPNESRHLAIFWNRAGRFYEKPDEVIRVPENAAGFDVADVDQVAGDELLLITSHGVTARGFVGRKLGESRVLIDAPSLFSLPDVSALPRFAVAQDVAGEGSRELLLLTPRAIEIFRRGETGYQRTARLNVSLESEINKQRRGRAERTSNIPMISMTLRFPAITVIDTNGDGRRDLVLSLDDRIAVYRQNPGLQFAAEPSFARDFAVRSVDDRKESWSWVGVSVLDLDADGAADLVVRKNVAKGIASASVTNYLYLGRKSGIFPEKPDQIVSNDGAGGAEVELLDITGDGHAELIVPSINIGIMAIIRYLTSESLKVNTQVYSFDAKKKRFSSKPIAERELDFDISLKGEADSEAFDMTGDYDGDRRPDLVISTEREELSIFRGLGSGSLFSEDATDKIAVRSFGKLLSADLDGRGKSDMILYYPRTNGHRSEVVVLKNLTGREHVSPEVTRRP